jgi:hypothetical protein
MEEVSIMKSVTNWISYLHDFVSIFPQFLAIFLHQKLISGIFENWKKQPPVGPAWQRHCRHVPRLD